MNIKNINKKLMLFGVVAMLSAAAVHAQQKPGGSFLASLGKGMWELRAVNGGPNRAAQNRICVGDASRLVQIQHGNSQCTQRILSAKRDRVTYSYACPGLGQGVTTIRKESKRLIHIESQGIRNGRPFNFSVEARLGGRC